MRRQPMATMDRFMEKVSPEPNTGCWLWLAHENKGTGYAIFAMKRASGWTMQPAHRVAYELYRGAIPSGLHIDHLCRVRICVNPDHLEAVTPRENVLRGVSPAAVAAQRSRCLHGHELTPASTRIAANGSRRCVTCERGWLADHRRRAGKPLGNKFKTHCSHGHEFTAENTYLDKSGWRHCRTCQRGADSGARCCRVTRRCGSAR